MARSLLISLKYLQSPQRYASLDTRLPFTGHASSSPHFHFSDICVACLFGKHVTPVIGMLVANGPSPTAFIIFLWRFPLLLTSLVFPSVALAAANTVSVKERMCEAKRACICSCMWSCWHVRAQRLLGCCLDCCLVMEIDTLFLFILPLSCHCCVWSEFVELRAMGPLENCQIH